MESEGREVLKACQVKSLGRESGLYYAKGIRLGRGAYGEVFLGWDEGRQREMAVKAVELGRLRREGNWEQLLGKLKEEIVNMSIVRSGSEEGGCSEVVEFYDAKESGKHLYILCEYCEGGSLEGLLRRRSHLTQPEALRFFRILAAFRHLHSKGVVHRDLKPANLLLHGNSIKLADLGFSKSIEDHQQLLESMVGTPLYMSPQIFDRQKYTEKTDIWSLGVILYEMLYGRNPWQGCANLAELRQRIKKDLVFPPRPHVTHDAQQLIRGMVQVDEHHRVDWNTLFAHFLDPPPPVEPHQSGLAAPTVEHFKRASFVEGEWELESVMEEAGVGLPGQQLRRGWTGHEEFFRQAQLRETHRKYLGEYYQPFLSRRNELAYLVRLLGGAQSLSSQLLTQSLLTNIWCLWVLVVRWGIAVTSEMAQQGQLHPQPPGELAQAVACCQRSPLLASLLEFDRTVLTQQLGRLVPQFEQWMQQVALSSPALAQAVQAELSGVLSSPTGEPRLIGFLIRNYLRRLFNELRGRVGESASPRSPESVLLKLTLSYLSEERLFGVGGRVKEWVHEWEAGGEQDWREAGRMEEEEVGAFVARQIRWQSVLMPGLL